MKPARVESLHHHDNLRGPCVPVMFLIITHTHTYIYNIRMHVKIKGHQHICVYIYGIQRQLTFIKYLCIKQAATGFHGFSHLIL